MKFGFTASVNYGPRCLLSLLAWATWAEMPESAGEKYKKTKMGVSMSSRKKNMTEKFQSKSGQ